MPRPWITSLPRPLAECWGLSAVRWKRALGVQKSKDAARARASQLLPAAAAQWGLRKHDGRAEAALLALYGARQLHGSPAPPGISASDGALVDNAAYQN